MWLNAKKPANVVVRKVSVAVPVDTKKQVNGNAQRRPPTANGTSTRSMKAREAGRKASHANADRYLAVARRQDSKSASPAPSFSSDSRRSSAQAKRKAPSPSGADFGEESSSEDEELPKKKARPANLGKSEPDVKRTLLDEEAMKDRTQDGDDETEEEDAPMIHGYDLTVGKFEEYNKYLSKTGEDDNEAAIAELQYPSRGTRERFQLVIPKDGAEFQPLVDIINSVEHICSAYFPEDISEELLGDQNFSPTAFVRRLNSAKNKDSGPQFLAALQDFNDFVQKHVDDGTIPNHLRSIHGVPHTVTDHILNQTFTRVVSPHVKTLQKYENGTNYVYGELMPKFLHKIFEETELRSDQVFVDLGSGVGNVVMQAALEIGCESWGVEYMKNPAGLAEKQLKEFIPRCKRWALKPGRVTLLQGDFLASPTIDEVLRRADVVLVNNQAFLPDLNSNLTMKFMDLKDGCKIVSLKSFLPDNWQIRERSLQDPRNLLMEHRKMEYFSGSVSWTHEGGTYYIATKNTRHLNRFVERLRRKGEGYKESTPIE